MPEERWTLFLRNRHLLGLTIAVTLTAGISALVALPRLEDPRITQRNPIVVTPFPGASAERVETLVTEPLEDALAEVDEIKELDSTSRSGISVIRIELLDGIESDGNEEIFSEIRDRLGAAAPRLPVEAGPPNFDDQRGAVAFTLLVGISWTAEDPPRLGILDRIAADLEDHLRQIPNTELVRRYGEPDEEITVEMDHEALARTGLTIGQVAGRIAAADARGPAGVLRGPASRIQLEVADELTDTARIGRVPLVSDVDGAQLRVSDVAEIERGWRDPPTEIALTGGHRTIIVGARMSADGRVGDWAEQAKTITEEIAARHGRGIELSVMFDQSHYTRERLAGLAVNLLLGASLVMIVVLTMMGWRMALIVGAALPLVSALVLFGILTTGAALHQMSVFGMIIALGLLIDNAIVVVDDIRRRKEAGATPEQALSAAIRQLAGPLGASTFTTVLAFAPIVLLPGNAGDFVGWIGGSVILAIAGSYLVSFTVIAALAALLGDPRTRGRRATAAGVLRSGVPGAWLSSRYRRVMTRGLRRPWLAMIVAASPALLGFGLAPTLGSQFFPPVDRDMFDIQVWMPNETSVDGTRRTVEAMEQVLLEDDAIERLDWLVGGSFPSVYYNLTMNQDEAPDYAQGVVHVRSWEDVEPAIARLQNRLDDAFPEAQVVLTRFGQGPPVDADVQYRIFGPDLATLRRLGERVRLVLQQDPGILHTRVGLEAGQPKLRFEAPEDAAARSGLGLSELASQLEASLEGATGGLVIEQLEQMNVRVRWSDAVRYDRDGLASAALIGMDGARIPLEALGALTLVPELAAIPRFDGERTNTILGYTTTGALPIDIAFGVLDRLEAEDFALPEGYRLELGGEVEADQTAQSNLATYVPVIATLMAAALILAFRSMAMAGVLALVALLSVGLGQLATWTIGFPVSFNTILGTLGLIGVALNDSIVVIAAIRDDPAARAGDPDAVLEQALSTTRHVLATTATTIGGFLPLLVLEGGSFFPSLAIVLAGGIPGASLLALGLVPAAYVLIHRSHRRERAATPTAPVPA